MGEDEEDVLLLAGALDLQTAEEVLSVAEDCFGDQLDAAAARFFVEELFSGR